ncbi:hypothetical protein DB42_AQ00490 [Neochlamydia sp. EPS4]|uniref:hypothetical protein n=1 Tax=Neochlamydia sp. EPS4 TaxID=1478175 RepID=UPI000583FC16|nr:hypothetical protein [Neochlamydia sp. EPS4]KIC75069.1 hypothetical protein DB42_AQ00490 [Neochlamydia sp. EPS4]
MLNVKSSPVPYQASKWLSLAMLIDEDEIQTLFQALGDFKIFSIGKVEKSGEGQISHEVFLANYTQYIQSLKSRRTYEMEYFRTFFTSVLTFSADHLYALSIGNDRQLIRIAKPVVQLQLHTLDYSVADNKFRSMVLGKDPVSWGLQFSYPQLYQDPQTHAVYKVGEAYANTALFRLIQQWQRKYTVPTPFLIKNKLINVPMRLGKKCFSWINQHPQLENRGLQVQIPHSTKSSIPE